MTLAGFAVAVALVAALADDFGAAALVGFAVLAGFAVFVALAGFDVFAAFFGDFFAADPDACVGLAGRVAFVVVFLAA